MRIVVLIATLAALAAGIPATFADSDLRALQTMTEGRGFEAVGRIEFRDDSFCTGVLISADTVLTAAHCLYDEDGKLYPAEGIRFLAGWRNGRAVTSRAVRAAVTHPDYFREEDAIEATAHDLGLLRLDQPVANGLVAPFAVAEPPFAGDTVSVVSYAFDRPDSPSLQDECHVLRRATGVLVLSCDVDFGSSGSPVLVKRHGTPAVVSVISAKAEDDEGRKVSLGTELAGSLAPLRHLLDEVARRAPGAAPQGRRLKVDGGRDIGGAKFVRP